MRDRPGLCVTVTAPTVRELRARRDSAGDADLVELRLDSVADPDAQAAVADRRRPVLVTCRAAWEGGSFRGSEEERRRLLTAALESGAEYVDVEWRAGFDDLIRARAGRGIVVSMHEFGPPPADLADRFRAMRATGAEVVKIAVNAERLSDTLPLLHLGRAVRGGAAVTLVAMGAAGLVTRALAAHFGSCWTYAGAQTHVGQVPQARLLKEFRFRSVTDATAVYGVVGRPVGHSVSPAMHNAGFDASGVDAVYVPLEAVDADDLVAFARAIGLRGCSVTAPFKRGLLRRVDEADETSIRIGALNTIMADGGRWVGRNTDVAGFLTPLEARLNLSGVRAAVLGTGGAARAAALALTTAGARVTLHAREQARAVEAASLTSASAAAWPPARGSWDLLVNATPVGTFPEVDASPMTGEPLDGRFVYDLVYNPSRTRLLADARAAGCEVLGGLPMLVEQARLQFEWWTGVRPPRDVFEGAALARLAEMAAEVVPEAAR